jgi:hypothetical protein
MIMEKVIIYHLKNNTLRSKALRVNPREIVTTVSKLVFLECYENEKYLTVKDVNNSYFCCTYKPQ